MAENWSRIECEAIVAAYFSMLLKELSGLEYNKTEHRNVLKEKLNSRTDSSIEYKHQNISAILLNAGHTYIKGYKPAWNYQNLLEHIVLERIKDYSSDILQAENDLLKKVNENQIDINWRSVFVDPPEKMNDHQIREPQLSKPRHTDYAEREARNRSLGKKGELFVLEVEKKRLADMGREDLLKGIEWTSSVKGDGAGYDIRSFYGKTDDELFIEVKTTNAGKYQPFLITANEVEFSRQKSTNYSLYRVFDFSENPAIFSLNGQITDHVNILPQVFRATF